MTVSSQIIEVLEHLGSKFGIAIDWTAENVLPYLEQLAGKYINWEIAISKMWIWIGAIIVVFGIVTILLDAMGDWYGIGFVFGAFIIIIGGVVIICQIVDILTCQHFPEKMVVEYVQRLINSSGGR